MLLLTTDQVKVISGTVVPSSLTKVLAAGASSCGIAVSKADGRVVLSLWYAAPSSTSS